MRDVFLDKSRGLSLFALLDSCSDMLDGCRNRALLSVAYDTGLRAAELVAETLADVQVAIDPDAGLLLIHHSRNSQTGEGATAFLSARSMQALAASREIAGIDEGPLFRRIFVRRLPAKLAVPRFRLARIENGMLRHGQASGTAALPARSAMTLGRRDHIGCRHRNVPAVAASAHAAGFLRM